MKKLTVIAGTFARLHRGHLALFDAAIDTGNKIVVGITSDEYVKKNKSRFVPFFVRSKAITGYLDSKNADYEIFELQDQYGDVATNPNYDTIVVSEETKEVTENMNEMRVKNGLNPMKVVVVPLSLDVSGEKISSTRILNGIIDKMGCYKDNIKVTVLGSSGGMSSSIRASAGYIVKYKNTMILMDCGDMTSVQLQKAGINVNEIDAIFISHQHLDHWTGLPLLCLHHMMLTGRTKKLTIYCDAFIMMQLNLIFEKNLLPTPFEVECNFIDEKVQLKDLLVERFYVDHNCPRASGFKISNDQGKVVVYSGDTKPCDAVIENSINADLLIHEATFCSDIGDENTHGHTKVPEAIEIGEQCNVKKLLLTHISLRYTHNMRPYFSDIEKSGKDNITVAEDLMEIKI